MYFLVFEVFDLYCLYIYDYDLHGDHGKNYGPAEEVGEEKA